MQRLLASPSPCAALHCSKRARRQGSAWQHQPPRAAAAVEARPAKPAPSSKPPQPDDLDQSRREGDYEATLLQLQVGPAAAASNAVRGLGVQVSRAGPN